MVGQAHCMASMKERTCHRLAVGLFPYNTGNNGCYHHVFINPYSTTLSNLIFHQLEIVSRYRDPQLQVGKICL